MASLWTSKSAPDPARDKADVADTGVADVGLPPPQPGSVPMARPQLSRNQPQPPPQQQPPPPPPPAPQQVGAPNDSLSLLQLRRIVAEFPKTDLISYDFKYGDTASFEEEVDEWFSYNAAEYKRLLRAKATFERRWRKFGGEDWLTSDPSTRKRFLEREIKGLQSDDLRRRCKSLQTTLHIVLGVWSETAGLRADGDSMPGKTDATPLHLEHMKECLILLAETGSIPILFEVLQNAFRNLWDDEFRDAHLLEEDIPFVQDELDNVTTVFYLVIEGARNDYDGLMSVRRKLLELNPSLVDYFVSTTARLRWDEANDLPQTRIFLFFWKSILLVLGGTAQVDEVKQATNEGKPSNGATGKMITASPLDYHIFRQEITSKYPAYIPPQPLIPLEPDNNSILPPLPNRPSRANGSNGIIPPQMNVNSSGASILNQPVHIATPAPSPPPSPPVGGKAGKKQNYQTNQNFPFMYPPLDSTSNSAGGKGAAGMQEFLVGRKWEGSDIPKSILEAGELFAGRMRMTRAMRQLWDERERFLKFERGWDGENDEIEELDLDTILAKKLEPSDRRPVEAEIDLGPDPAVSDNVRLKLEMVEAFYQGSLPHLQSLVIVLLKAVLANVTALITHPMGAQSQSGQGSGYRSEVNLRNGAQGQRPPDPANVPLPNNPIDPSELTIDETEALRSREITAKAVSGILLMLLKWFKVSHILKFEYLTQLLLDSNYLPLVLKLFAHQDVDRIVDYNTDRDEMSFFAFCNGNSKNAPISQDDEGEDDESPDEAAPPPIKTGRGVPATDAPDQLPAVAYQDGQHAVARKQTPPAVDELGYPTSSPPPEPIIDYSWRNFFSSINFLRIMQKICKNKAHRNLLLVQYKSSQILKKSLKVPQPELRLYTLKLFKNQVPYCGRKWRQGNMRVITSVYLHCRPELRDDWLAGSDVDAEVEEALPLEQALRALTHWHNIKRYPGEMGADTKLLEEEHDFFVRELERMEWTEADEGESVLDGGSVWDGQSNAGGW